MALIKLREETKARALFSGLFKFAAGEADAGSDERSALERSLFDGIGMAGGGRKGKGEVRVERGD